MGIITARSEKGWERVRKSDTAFTLAPAKVNLVLRVYGRRDDGYHEIQSRVMGIGLYDEVRCRRTSKLGIQVDCSDRSLNHADNLAVRAVQRLAESAGVSPACLSIRLTKRIPIGGGMGGGSSDAASALRLCNHLWGLGETDEKLAKIGSTIGSDVPLFFCLPSAIITGRGEHVARSLLSWSGFVLLIVCPEAVSTRDVYQAWRPSDCRPSGHDVAENSVQTARELMELAGNDLEPAVFRVSPSVQQIWQEVNKAGLGSFRISGAGSTLFRLYDGREDAQSAAECIKNNLGSGRLQAIVAEAPVGQSPIQS